MKPMVYRLAIVLSAVILYTTGCASTHLSLVKDGTVSLEYIPSEGDTFVSKADVYRLENGIKISGTVKVPKALHYTRGGHVDVAILSSDGALLKKASIQHNPRNPRRTSAHKLPFRAYIPIQLPPDSTIRIAYHKPSFPQGDAVFDCESNSATSTVGTGASH
jgi:hypothetical protein